MGEDQDQQLDQILSIPIIIVSSILFISIGYGVMFKGDPFWLIIWISQRLS